MFCLLLNFYLLLLFYDWLKIVFEVKMYQIDVRPLVLNKKSKSSKFASWHADGNSLWDEFLRILYLFVLISIDLVVFVYSINGELLEDGIINKAFLVILLGIFLLSSVLILLLSFSKVWQNALCAIVTMLVTVVFCNQFMIRDLDVVFDTFLMYKAEMLGFLTLLPVTWYIGAILGIVVFILFYSIYGTIFITLVLLIAGGIGIKNYEFIEVSKEDYVTVQEMSKKAGITKDKNIIYFMLPKFPSYQFLDNVNDDNFKELKNLMLGFYATNKFEVYSNAFVAKSDIMNNVAEIYNQVDYLDTRGINRGYAEYINNWEFIKGDTVYASLENNKLYDNLFEEGYGISTYSMPGFDLCLTKDEMYTHRCVARGLKRVKLYNDKVNLENNVYALLAEWLNSFKFYFLRSTVKILADKSWIKNIKVLSQNRRISNESAIKVFDKLMSNIEQDNMGHVYMVYVDLPSINYVYDEYCNIKPRKDWMAINDNNIYAGGITEKRKAYVDQTKCLIGKMQIFIDYMKENKKLVNSDIIIQGVSSARELAEMGGGRYANFVADNLVGMAIRKSAGPKFVINQGVCLASDFAKTIIQNKGFCYSVDDMKIADKELKKLKKSLLENSYMKRYKMINIVSSYRDWFEVFANNNNEDISIREDVEELDLNIIEQDEEELQENWESKSNEDDLQNIEGNVEKIEDVNVDNNEEVLLDEVNNNNENDLKKIDVVEETEVVETAVEETVVVKDAVEENVSDNMSEEVKKEEQQNEIAKNVEVIDSVDVEEIREDNVEIKEVIDDKSLMAEEIKIEEEIKNLDTEEKEETTQDVIDDLFQ